MKNKAWTLYHATLGLPHPKNNDTKPRQYRRTLYTLFVFSMVKLKTSLW